MRSAHGSPNTSATPIPFLPTQAPAMNASPSPCLGNWSAATVDTFAAPPVRPSGGLHNPNSARPERTTSRSRIGTPRWVLGRYFASSPGNRFPQPCSWATTMQAVSNYACFHGCQARLLYHAALERGDGGRSVGGPVLHRGISSPASENEGSSTAAEGTGKDGGSCLPMFGSRSAQPSK